MNHKQKKSYGVIGLGRFGMALAIKLAQAGVEYWVHRQHRVQG